MDTHPCRLIKSYQIKFVNGALCLFYVKNNRQQVHLFEHGLIFGYPEKSLTINLFLHVFLTIRTLRQSELIFVTHLYITTLMSEKYNMGFMVSLDSTEPEL